MLMDYFVGHYLEQDLGNVQLCSAVVALRVNSYPQVITDTLLALQTSQTVEKYTLTDG